MPFSVTQGYIQQKAVVLAEVANSDLSNYFDLLGNEIITAGTTASDTDTSEYQSDDIPYLVDENASNNANNFIKKNERLIKQYTPSQSLSSLYKVPAKRIYYRKDPY